jgi:hypothetical protein
MDRKLSTAKPKNESNLLNLVKTKTRSSRKLTEANPSRRKSMRRQGSAFVSGEIAIKPIKDFHFAEGMPGDYASVTSSHH